MGFGAIGLIGSVASTGLGIYGAAQQAKAQTAAAEYNNRLAQAEARNLEATTAENITRQRIRHREKLADLRTRMAAGGLRTTTGAPLIVQGDAAGRMELEIADAARSTAMQAEAIRAKGQMGIWEAKQASQAATIKGVGKGLAGLSDAYGKYRDMRYTGTKIL